MRAWRIGDVMTTVLSPRDDRRPRPRLLSAALVVLGGGIAVAATIDPLMLNALDYLACSVTGMAAVMWFTDDPDASGVTLVGSAGPTLALGGFVSRVYLLLFGGFVGPTAVLFGSALREKVK